jgi:hypothetical protein
MSRKVIGVILGLGLAASLGIGIFTSGLLQSESSNNQSKSAIQAKGTELRLDAVTPVVMEKEYLRSHKVLISDFEYKQDIIDHSLDEIRAKYTEVNGFTISFKDNSLIIHQTIDDWSPEDKAKYRLKEFRGMVAIYIGPDGENDSLQRVTAIRFATLPSEIKEAIEQGRYEFNSEEAVNDALENLDEYF